MRRGGACTSTARKSVAATPPEASPGADAGPWIEGRFEGIYAGDQVGERRDGARRYDVRVQSGALVEASVATAPDAELRADPFTLQQDRLAPVRLPAIPALERCARETALFDVHITEWRLKHPAERDGRGFGTIEGTLCGRLAPEAPPLEAPPAELPTLDAIPILDVTAELVTEEVTAEPIEETSSLGHAVAGADAAAVVARFWWLAALFLFAMFALMLGGLCSPRTAAIWAGGIAAGASLRRVSRSVVVSGTALQGWMAALLIAAQLLGLLGPLEASWQAGCRAPIRADLLWVALPMLFAALLRHPGAWITTGAVWTLVLCAWCTQLDGACGAIAASAPPEATASAPVERARLDASGRWPAGPGGSGFGPQAGGGVAGGAGFPSGSGGVIPTHGLAGSGRIAVPSGAVIEGDARAARVPRGTIVLPDEVAASPAPGAARPGRVAQIPGGWVAPDHRRTERDVVLISVEQANRTPDAFFASDGRRRVYLPTDPLFDDGGAKLRPRADLDLTRLAAVLSLQPTRRVVLELHTDSAGAPEAQQALAERRAARLREWLLDRGHLSAQQFDVSAVGGADPLVPPDGSYAAQQPNRRIEVRLVD